MNKETLRMQMLAGIITEGQYKRLLEDMEVVDRILDKISAQGKDSLSDEEKAYLDNYSKGDKNLEKPTTFQNPPYPWKEETETHFYDADEDYEIIKMWEAPGEGKDSDNPDSVQLIKQPDGTYEVIVYISFGEPEEYGPFSNYEEAYKEAITAMKEIKEEW